MKLNNIIANRALTIYGFEAFTNLAAKCNHDARPAVLSTLPPSMMYDMGMPVYFAPVIPRDSRFGTPEEIIDADLDCNLVRVAKTDEIKPDDEVIIVSRHPGTVSLLQNMYPNNVVLDQVSGYDIDGKTVVGTLPPHLIQYAARYQSVTIRDFDYTRDGDIAGEELEDRLVIGKPVSIEVYSGISCPICGSQKQMELRLDDTRFSCAPEDGYAFIQLGNAGRIRARVCLNCGNVYIPKIEIVEGLGC